MGEYRGNLEVTKKRKAGFWRDGEWHAPYKTANEKARQRQQWDDETLSNKAPAGVNVSRNNSGNLRVEIGNIVIQPNPKTGKTSIFIGDDIHGLVESNPEAVKKFIEKNT